MRWWPFGKNKDRVYPVYTSSDYDSFTFQLERAFCTHDANYFCKILQNYIDVYGPENTRKAIHIFQESTSIDGWGDLDALLWRQFVKGWVPNFDDLFQPLENYVQQRPDQLADQLARNNAFVWAVHQIACITGCEKHSLTREALQTIQSIADMFPEFVQWTNTFVRVDSEKIKKRLEQRPELEEFMGQLGESLMDLCDFLIHAEKGLMKIGKERTANERSLSVAPETPAPDLHSE